NAGVERQIGKKLVLSADFVHNTNVHSPLAHDVNLIGAASTLNVTSAAAAIALTESAFGCATVDCTIQKGATISDYASNGLGSPASGFNGQFVPPNSRLCILWPRFKLWTGGHNKLDRSWHLQ